MQTCDTGVCCSVAPWQQLYVVGWPIQDSWIGPQWGGAGHVPRTVHRRDTQRKGRDEAQQGQERAPTVGEGGEKRGIGRCYSSSELATRSGEGAAKGWAG